MSDKTSHAVWFSAMLAFQSVTSDDADAEPVFEARLVLLRARSEEEAYQKASALGRSEQDDYRNAMGSPVSFRFVEVIDVCCLSWVEDIQDGTEAYYAHLSGGAMAELRSALRTSFRDGERGENGEAG